MNASEKSKAELPIRGSLRPNYTISLVIAILMVAAPSAGLLYQAEIYPSNDLLHSFLPTDVSVLLIGLPMLLGSMWLTWRGKLVGLLLWPGTLFFTLYNYLVYVFAMQPNLAFLLHLLLVMLSAYMLVALLTSIYSKPVRQALSGAVPERLSGGILAGLGFVFFVRATSILINGLANPPTISEIELASNSVDFLIAPAWIAGGLMLWRRRAFGYVAGLGLLFQASMLFIGLIIFLLLQPIVAGTALALIDIAVVLAMGLICFIPFGLFMRGVVTGWSKTTPGFQE